MTTDPGGPPIHVLTTGAHGRTTGAQRGHFGDGPGRPDIHVLAEEASRTPIAFAVGGKSVENPREHNGSTTGAL